MMVWREVMIRKLYGLAWWLTLPLVVARLWRRGKAEPGYRRHIPERFSWYPATDADASSQPGALPLIWLHAVSVGETRAAEPLVTALLDRYPDHALLLTHMTPTGRATGKALFARYGTRIRQAYLPYDTGWMTRRFLRRYRPRLGILMETEVWPSLMQACRHAELPVVLVNARLSERSLKKGRRFASLLRPAAEALACVAAQTEADAQRLRAFGAQRVEVTGSIKFDVSPPEAMLALGRALREQMGDRPVLLCASTREGEEALLLDAWTSRRDIAARPLLLLVPRHPQRFADVAQMVQERGLSLVRRSAIDFDATAVLPPSVDVLLGDTMGEMFAYYAACDMAFIGGSLLPLGGQNLIEACAVGKPVLIGRHTFNFLTVSEDAVAAGAALRVESAEGMMNAALGLMEDAVRCREMGKAAGAFAFQHRGATARTMALIAPLLERTDR